MGTLVVCKGYRVLYKKDVAYIVYRCRNEGRSIG
jgi:hypothetical protein